MLGKVEVYYYEMKWCLVNIYSCTFQTPPRWLTSAGLQRCWNRCLINLYLKVQLSLCSRLIHTCTCMHCLSLWLVWVNPCFYSDNLLERSAVMAIHSHVASLKQMGVLHMVKTRGDVLHDVLLGCLCTCTYRCQWITWCS